MFGQFSEQMKKSSQPASELVEANVKALEAVATQQTQFFSGFIDDSIKLMQTMSEQTEMKGIVAAQSVYAESVRERFSNTSKNTYNTLNSVSQQCADSIKSGLETASEAAQDTMKNAAAQTNTVAPVVKPKSAPAKAASAKTATKKASATPAKPKAAAVKTEKAVTAKTAVKSKSSSTTAAKKPVTKTATTVKAAPKAAAKPVASLSADEVKAPTKAKTTDVKAATSPETKA